MRVFSTSGTRYTRATFPATAVIDPDPLYRTTAKVLVRRPYDKAADPESRQGQSEEVLYPAGTYLRRSEIDDLFPAATITSVSPATADIGGGTVVTIRGTHLDGVTAATFGGAAGTNLKVVNEAEVRVTAPAHAAGVVDVAITDDGVAPTVTATGAVTYAVVPATITSISPATGPAAGVTVVTITGTNLAGATAVSFGGTAGTAFSVVSPTQVRATTPAHAAGAVDVVVTDNSGPVTATGAFTYA